MDGDVGLMSRYVGGTHRALQIDLDVRKGLLEFDEARGEPECSESLGDGDPHFARQRIGDAIAGAQQLERCSLHALDCRDDLRALVGQTGAVNIAGEQGRADLTFEIVDPPAHRIDGQIEPLGCRSEAAAANHFQKNPRRVPIGKTAERDLIAFLLRNAPFRCQMHTSPLRRLSLAEYWGLHNLDGSLPTL